MFTLVILYTLYTLVYPVYPCLPESCCIPWIPLYILCTHVYPSNTVYLVYPVYPCLPESYCIPWIPLDILCTHVYPSHTVYPLYPYISCVPIYREYFIESAGVRYLRTSCGRIRNRTSKISDRKIPYKSKVLLKEFFSLKKWKTFRKWSGIVSFVSLSIKKTVESRRNNSGKG